MKVKSEKKLLPLLNRFDPADLTLFVIAPDSFEPVPNRLKTNTRREIETFFCQSFFKCCKVMSSVKSFVTLQEKYDRIVVLIDMDCFYCQVEEYLDPERLANKPIGKHRMLFGQKYDL